MRVDLLEDMRAGLVSVCQAKRAWSSVPEIIEFARYTYAKYGLKAKDIYIYRCKDCGYIHTDTKNSRGTNTLIPRTRS